MSTQFGQQSVRLKAVGYIGWADSRFESLQFQEHLISYLKEYAANHAFELMDVIIEKEHTLHLQHLTGVQNALHILEKGGDILIVLLDKPDAVYSGLLISMLKAFEDKKFLDITQEFLNSNYHQKKNAALLLLEHSGYQSRSPLGQHYGLLKLSGSDIDLKHARSFVPLINYEPGIAGSSDYQLLSLARKMRITALYLRVMACEIKEIHRQNQQLSAFESLKKWKHYL